MAGRHRNPDVKVKEEPPSPSQPATKKRKAFSPVDGQPIRYVSVIDVNSTTTTRNLRKKSRTEDVAPKPARKSARTGRGSPKKELAELCRRFGRELMTVAKTMDEIADNMD